MFMGKEDTERQALNVYRMRLLGAKVHAVESGTATLKDAVSETMREWTNRIADTHYVLGSVMGPHPFPTIVRDFQDVYKRQDKGAKRCAVCLNAGAALYIAGKSETMEQGVRMAEGLIDSGAALAKLEEFIRESAA